MEDEIRKELKVYEEMYDHYINKLLETNVPYEESEYYNVLHDLTIKINLLKSLIEEI